MSALADAAGDAEAIGARIVAIVPDQQPFAAKLRAEANAPFPILTDTRTTIALSLGLVYWLGAEVRELMREHDYDLAESQGNDSWFVPVPATFVIDKNGRVTTRHVDPDYRKRIEVNAVLDFEAGRNSQLLAPACAAKRIRQERGSQHAGYIDPHPDCRFATSATSGLHHLVVVGGGAGGLELATRLGDKLGRKGKAKVTLIDRSRTHIWKPLYEIAAGSLNVARNELDYLAQGHWHGFQFRYGEMKGVDRSKRLVHLAATFDDEGRQITPERSFHYDTLVVAIGSEGNDFGTPGGS